MRATCHWGCCPWRSKSRRQGSPDGHNGLRKLAPEGTKESSDRNPTNPFALPSFDKSIFPSFSLMSKLLFLFFGGCQVREEPRWTTRRIREKKCQKIGKNKICPQNLRSHRMFIDIVNSQVICFLCCCCVANGFCRAATACLQCARNNTVGRVNK